jgi:hypothetical protein
MAERSSRRVIHVQNQAIISMNMNEKSNLLCKCSAPEEAECFMKGAPPGRRADVEEEEEEEEEEKMGDFEPKQ